MKRIAFGLMLVTFGCVSGDETTDLLRELNGTVENLQEEIKELKKRVQALEKATGATEASNETIEYKDSGKKFSNEEAAKQIEKVAGLIEQGDYDTAWNILKDFVINSRNKLYMGQACFYSGRVLDYKQKYNKAMEFYIKSVQMNPRGQKAPASLRNLADCLIKLKKIQPSEKDKFQTMLKKTLQSLKQMGIEAKKAATANPNLRDEPYFDDAIRHGKWATEKLKNN